MEKILRSYGGHALAIVAILLSVFALAEVGQSDIESMGLHPGSTSTISGDVTVTGDTPLITVGDAGAEDTTILFDGNAQDYYIALDDTADDILIGLGSVVGTTPGLGIDENLAVATYGDVTMGGTTPVLTVGDAGAEDAAVVFDGNAQDFYIGLDDTADELVFGVGSALGTTQSFAVDSSANVDISGTLQYGANDLYPIGWASASDVVYCAASGIFTETTTIDLSGTFSDIDYIVATQITTPAATGSILTVADPGAGTNAVLNSWESDFTVGTTGVNAFYCAFGDE